MTAFQELFRPCRINRLEVGNRIVMAAIGNNLADDEGYVTDRAIDYYVERARGGSGNVLCQVGSFIGGSLSIGILGFFMRWSGFTPVAMVLGMVLGERLEQSLRQALMISSNGVLIFLTKPISLFFLLLTAAVVAVDVITRKKGRIADDKEG